MRVGMVTAVVVTIATLAGCAPVDVNDAFYRAELPDRSARPGDVIRSRPSRFTLDPFTGNQVGGVRSWQVLYHSVDALGRDTAVSGTVLVPAGAWTGPGARPLVSYGVGSRGVGDQCAPSHTLSNGLDYEGSVILEALRRGWAVAVTDMIGLGTPGVHTYGVGRDQGHATIDVVRAAQRMPETGLSLTNPVGFWGYSQGGQTAAWAAELAPSYAPELNVAAVVAAGVPADLKAVTQRMDGGLFFALAMLSAGGYDAAYPDLQLPSFLNDRGRRLFTQLDTMCIVDPIGFQLFINSAFRHPSDYTATDPLATPQWSARLDENKLGRGRPSAPTLLMQAPDDQLVPLQGALALRDGWCRNGANVTWNLFPFGEHVLGLLMSISPALDFLTARFAGEPTTGSCPT